MGFTCEGTIEIDLVDFWEFVAKYRETSAEIAYGVPRVNRSNNTMEIDFAESSDGDPAAWSVKPESVTQWEQLKDE